MDDSQNRRRSGGLGRGLGALISKSAAVTPDSEKTLIAQAEAGGVRMLPIDAVLPNPQQPRRHFDEEGLNELAASIAQHGIIQPVVVSESTNQPERYHLIAGERRWRAAQNAGLEEVPAIVREVTPQQLLEWALVENVQRADLQPLEEAEAYAALISDFGLTQAQVAERVGKSRSAVGNSVRLLSLPQSIKDALSREEISAGHARALLRLEEEERMQSALKLIVDRGLNVRQTESMVATMLAPGARSEEPPAEDDTLITHLHSLEDRFRQTLGTKVKLDRREDGSGRLVVHFYNDDDLDQIYRQIVGGDEW